MTEDDDLRDELAALRERVRRIEAQLEQDDPSPSAGTTSGTDHRDAAVLSAVADKDNEPSRRELVRLYQHETDIVDRDTAKQRAKTLRRSDAYRRAVRE